MHALRTRLGLLAVIGGVVLGTIGARWVFVGSARSLLPWGSAAVALGLAAGDRRQALRCTAAYGATLTTTFLVVGREGTSTPWLGFSLLTITVAVVGAACAAALGLGAVAIAHRVVGRRSTHLGEGAEPK